VAEDKRKLQRRNFTYYMRVLDKMTGKLIGQISDISTGGFKIESAHPLPVGIELNLYIDQMNEISDKSYLAFTARTRWCQIDPYDPTVYNVGFQLVNMTPADYNIFVKMFNTYGSQKGAHQRSNSDYSWR
jgi:hypothetical protein